MMALPIIALALVYARPEGFAFLAVIVAPWVGIAAVVRAVLL